MPHTHFFHFRFTCPRGRAYNLRMTRRFSRYYWFTCQVGG